VRPTGLLEFSKEGLPFHKRIEVQPSASYPMIFRASKTHAQLEKDSLIYGVLHILDLQKPSFNQEVSNYTVIIY